MLHHEPLLGFRCSDAPLTHVSGISEYKAIQGNGLPSKGHKKIVMFLWDVIL